MFYRSKMDDIRKKAPLGHCSRRIIICPFYPTLHFSTGRKKKRGNTETTLVRTEHTTIGLNKNTAHHGDEDYTLLWEDCIDYAVKI